MVWSTNVRGTQNADYQGKNGLRGTPKRHQMIGLIPHFQQVKCHTQSSSSELEVDERLEVSGDELADDEDGEDADEGHQREGHRGEPDAVAALEVLGEPMDDHSEDEDEDHTYVLLSHLRDQGQVPVAADALDHILCCAPRFLVRFRRIQVGAASEEKAGKSNEYERHSDRPTCLKPREGCLEAAQMVEHPHGGAYEYDQCPDEEHIEHRSRDRGLKNIKGQAYETYDERPDIDIAAFPEPVDQHSETVQTAPDHKVPAGSVPQTAKEHRVHPVDVRDQFLAVFLAEGDQKCQHCRNDQNHSENPPVLGQSRGQESDSEDDRIRAECAIAVASKRDVKIVLKPFGKGNMPPLPELSGVAGLIRRIEVLRQIETHQHSDTGGDVSVPGEVGIDLKRVAEESRKVLETGVKQRVLENPVTEIHSQIVAQNQLLGKSVQNPENRDTELSAAKEERFVKLREKLFGAHDRAGHKLRKETQVEAEIPEVLDRADCPA